MHEKGQVGGLDDLMNSFFSGWYHDEQRYVRLPFEYNVPSTSLINQNVMRKLQNRGIKIIKYS